MSCLMGYSIIANLCCGDIERFKVIINGGLAQEYIEFRYLSKINMLYKGFTFDPESLKEAREYFKKYILDKSLAMGYKEIHDFVLANELFRE